MSPKQCSLAVEEAKEVDFNELDFQPKLKVLINKRLDSSAETVRQAVVVRGRISVSF